MGKYRKAAKIDENQHEIVDRLREIPGVTVELNHDDILVGRNGKTYWIEIKSPDAISKKTGKPKKGEIKPSQEALLKTWAGHYSICWTLDQILKEIGIK